MCNYKRLYLCVVIALIFVAACSSVPAAQTALTTLQGSQGGMIVYGLVDGAATPAMAMAHILRIVQNNCGDKPQIGKVFRVRGQQFGRGVLYRNEPCEGNVPVAGMLIASPTQVPRRSKRPW